MRESGCLSIGLLLLLVILLPFVFSHILISALVKLRLDPMVALQLGIGIILGSVINIPVKRIVRTESVPVDPFAVFGFWGLMPRFQRVRQETVIAVNLGGCVIPVGVADLLHLRDISKISTGMASIGGAGTFDGIVLSGIVATYLA